MGLSIGVAAIMVFLSFASVAWSIVRENNAAAALAKQRKKAMDMGTYQNNPDVQTRYVTGTDSYGSGNVHGHGQEIHHRPRDNYSQNFV